MFKRFPLLVAIALTAAPLLAATESFSVDKAHSEATFQVRHLMSRVSGRFEDFSGTINLDRRKPAASTVEFTIKAASINTGIGDRDKHLRSDDFFDADQYPEIAFKSTSIKPTRRRAVYEVTGDFTMRGVTKRITIPVTFLGFAKDPWGNERAGFALATKLNRKEYGVNWNKALDNGGWLVGDDVDVLINIEAAKKN